MREKLVIFEDNEQDYLYVFHSLIALGYDMNSIIRANDVSFLLNIVDTGSCVLLIGAFYEKLETIVPYFPSAPYIILAAPDEKDPYRYIKDGAQDFLVKNLYSEKELGIAIKKAIARTNAKSGLWEAQKNMYESILSSLTEVVWSCYMDTNELLYVNEACYDIYGYTPQEMIADSNIFFNALHPEDKEMLLESFTELFEKGRTANQFRIIRKDGAIKYLKGSAVVKKGVNGGRDIYSGVSIDITELQAVENALREKILETEEILESITDAFFTVDDDWYITEVNNKAVDMYGIAREDVLNKKLWECFPAPDTSPFKVELKKAAREQIHVSFEEVSAITGKWLSIRVYPQKRGLAVYFRDISEQKELQDQIISDSESIKAIINNTDDIIWSFDEHMNVILANQAYYKRVEHITGKEGYSELTDNDFDEAVLNKWNAYFKRALNNESYRVIEKDTVHGKTVYEEISFNPILDNKGNVKGVSCFSRDITEEKKLQEKILKDDQNLKALINNTQDFLWSVDTEMRIISANQAYKDFTFNLYGIVPEPGVSALYTQLEEKIKENRIEHYREALSGKSTIIVEDRILFGQQVYRELSFNPIRSDNGEMGVSCFARDISAHKQQLMKIKDQNEKLKEIAWIQSHEVRGPLATILGLITLLDNDKPDNKEHLNIFEGIKESAKKLDNIIKEIVGRTYGISDIDEK